MNYYIEVLDGSTVIERLIFESYDCAIYFAERRRKQGYIVTIRTITIK